jgi:hypothetical protein
MSRVLDMMWTDIVTTWASARDWLAGVGGDGGIWLVLLGAALMLVLLMLLLPSGRRRQPAESRPQLLVSRGEVRSVEESNLTELSMHVSNLGDGVAQLLEVALSSDLMPTPETVELSVLVPRSRSVDVLVPVEELHGDSGFLDLYFYTPQTRKRAFRLRAELTWEPWNGRFKIEPLGQRIDSARRLASSRLQQRQREEWRRRQREMTQEAAAPVEPEQEPEEAVAEEPVSERERLEFPTDF